MKRGGEEEEYKEHLSLQAAAATLSDEKIIYLCKFVISGRGEERSFEYVALAHTHTHTCRMSKGLDFSSMSSPGN